MEVNNNKVTPENSAEWLASCGFIFPRSEKELARFDLLSGGVDPGVPAGVVDPFRIIRNTDLSDEKATVVPLRKRKTQLRLVAAQLRPLPAHILRKVGKKDSDGPDMPESAG